MKFLFAAFVAILSTELVQGSADFPYVYANVGPSSGGTNVRFGCLDANGCEVQYSTAACGCDSTCSGVIHLGNYSQGAMNISEINGWGVGGLLCSTGQLSAIHSGSFEVAPVKMAGSNFAYLNYRNGANVACHFVSVYDGVTSVNISTNGGAPTTLTLSNKYSTDSVTNLASVSSGTTANFISMTSNSPVVIGCHSSTNNDFVVVQPLSDQPVYGWVSQNVRGAHVDCTTYATASAFPDCTASSDETANSGFAVDSTTPQSPFSQIFGFVQNGINQRFYKAPSFECHSSEGLCMSVFSTADSSGNEMTAWLPADKFSDYFVVLDDMSLSSALSIDTATCLRNGNAWITTSGTSLVKFAEGSTLSSGDIISCDTPVSLILQRSDNKEMNYFGFQSESTWVEFIPTPSPTDTPTESPTKNPSTSPTESPTESPSAAPTENPSSAPTTAPTKNPSASPTESPTESPSKAPTESPTSAPTGLPTESPTEGPTTTPVPTEEPTEEEGLGTGAVVGAVAGAVGAAGLGTMGVLMAMQAANAAGGAAAASGGGGNGSPTFAGGLETTMSPDAGTATAAQSPAPPADMIAQTEFFVPPGTETAAGFEVDAGTLFVEELVEPSPTPSSSKMRKLLKGFRRSTGGGGGSPGLDGLL